MGASDEGRRTVTASVLFVDVVGSTELRARLGEEAADEVRRDLDRRLAVLVDRHHGRVLKGLGDGVLAVFDAAVDAVDAGVAIQQHAELDGRRDLGPNPGRSVALRVGISTGDVSFEAGDVFGTPVVEASRLCAAAQAGQVLVADVVRSLARGRGAHHFEPVGELPLKGLPDPVAACQVLWEPLAAAPMPGGAEVPMPGLLAGGAPTAYVGREEILDRIGAAWARVRGGGGCEAVLLSGEPGVGKTRTAAEVAQRAHLLGALVLYGSCDEGLSVPFQPFVEALEFHTAHDAAPALGRLAGELVRLLPELEQRVPGLAAAVSSDPQTEEYRLFEAVASWLIEASHRCGLVVVLDDLHWATRATLLLLVHLLKGAAADGSARLLVVGTYRDTEVDRVHPLSSVLADLRRLQGVERFDLGGLSSAEVLALAETAAGHELDGDGRRLTEAIYAETDGNPFFVVEVLRHLVETGQVRLVEGRWQVIDPERVLVPEGVREVVGRRLGRLSESANRVLSVASAVGRDFDLELVGTVVDLDENVILDGLDEACRARLVEETGADRFRFAHAVVRDTLYRELSSTRRRRLHHRVTDALEKLRPHDAAALAHHALEAGPAGGDVTQAVRYLLAAAGQATAAGARAEAEVCYRQALELLDDDDQADSALRMELLCGLGETQRDQGDPAFRQTLLDAGWAALSAGRVDLAVRAAVANFRGLTSILSSVDRERVTLLEAILGSLGDEPSAGAALLHATLAAELAYDTELPVERRLDLTDRAIDMARSVGDDRVRAEVLIRTAIAAAVPETWETQLARSTEAVSLADATGDPTLRALARTMAMSPWMVVGDFDRARRLTSEAVEISQHDCPPFVTLVARWVPLQFLAYDGDLDGFEAANNEMFAATQQVAFPDGQQWWGANAACAAVLRAEEGDLADLVGGLVDEYPGSMGWTVAHAQFLALAGRTEEARRVLSDSGLRRPAALPRDHLTLNTWGNLGRCALHLEDPELGAAAEEVLRPYQHQWPHFVLLTLGPVLSPLASSVAAQGRWDEAIELFDAADAVMAERGLTLFRLLAWRYQARGLAASSSPAHIERCRQVAERALRQATERGLDRLAGEFEGILAGLPPT